MSLLTWLQHPLTRGLAIDDPRTTQLRRRIVMEKRSLRSVYDRWYGAVLQHVPDGEGAVLEIGSGAGFFSQRLSTAITSDYLFLPDEKLTADARALPFRDAALRSIVMVDAFHHIPDAGAFLSEAERCLRVGGTIAMIEPWVTWLSKRIYRHLHHEPFDTGTPVWQFPSTGPLSGANSALPWIIFDRDAEALRQRHPRLRIRVIRPTTVVTYLLSGGISMRSLAPSLAWPIVEGIEALLSPLRGQLAMFALIVVERTEAAA